jgi:hypothetical protein
MEIMLAKCRLRGWRLIDAASLAIHANNGKVWLGLRDLFPHPYTIEDPKFLRLVPIQQPRTDFCVDISGPAGGIGIRLGTDVH